MKVEFSLDPVSSEVHFHPSFKEGSPFFKKIASLTKNVILLAESLYAKQVEIELQKQGITVLVFLLQGGEVEKSRKIKEEIEDFFIEHSIGKDFYLVTLGGGAILDLGGFVASTYLRGIPYISIPTTLLAMVDACLGGKTGLNALGIKNRIGTFYPASHILICGEVLHSLNESEMHSALAEICKYGLISSPTIFSLLKTENNLWKERNDLFLEKLVYLSLEAKKNVVEKDFHEKGLRRILNFGHNIGHAIESFFEYSCPHGEAIAIGLFIESYLSFQKGLLRNTELQAIISLLLKYEFPRETRPFSFKELRPFLIQDKKNQNGTCRFVLLNSIGQPEAFDGEYCLALSEKEIENGILWYQETILKNLESSASSTRASRDLNKNNKISIFN